MNGAVSREDLLGAEAIFASRGLGTDVDLCPYADASALEALAKGGYVVNGFVNAYARILSDEDLMNTGGKSQASEIEIVGVTPDKVEDFIRASASGFASSGRPVNLLETLARVAVLRSDTLLYFAFIDGKVAGSAGMALIETSRGGVALLYIDSVLPEYQRRGIQVALLQARMAEARKEGFDLAVVEVRQANVSSRNTERVGFELAFNRLIFSRALEGA